MTKRITIKASRWPWQEGYNWQGSTGPSAPLNPRRPGKTASPRFGGGWSYALGFEFAGGIGQGYVHILFNLLFGMVSVIIRSKRQIEEERVRDEKWAENRKRLKEENEARHKNEPAPF